MAWIETSKKNPCPICGKTGWCSVTDDGAAVFCHRVNNGAGKHIICKDGGEGWLYRLNGEPMEINPPPEQPKVARAADGVLHKVYTELLKNLELSAKHREDLLRRGLTQEAIEANRYRTLPLRGRSGLTKILVDVYGQDVIASVPGFYLNNSNEKPYWSIAGSPGILIPIRNFQGQITGLKIRLDEPDDTGKYKWLSSKGHGGPGPANSVHVPKFSGDTSTVRVTEGELKADVTTVLSGTLTISIPGVSCWRQATPVLKKLGARTVLVAFDADAGTNSHVARALKCTIQELAREGFQVLLEKWDIRDGKGIDDLLAAGKKPSVIKPLKSATKTPLGISATELICKNFPDPVWVVPGLLPEGLAILAGRPKIGKSWLALGVAVAVASGGVALGQIKVAKGHVLYLALEDSPRRLKNRLTSALQGEEAPQALHFFTEFPRLDQGGLQALEDVIQAHNAKLLIIDTLAKMRPPGRRNGDVYQQDYSVMGSLKTLADRHNAAVLILHHQNKQGYLDILDSVSGSTGVTGAADTTWVLKRSRGKADAELFAVGRDFEEKELALEFDRHTTSWHIMGSAEEYRLTQERREIIDVLREANKPLAPKEVATVLGKPYQAIAQLLYKMSKAGEIAVAGYGKYTTIIDQSSKSDQGGISDQSGKSRNGSYFDRGGKCPISQQPQGPEGIFEGEL
ncbi:MAG: AAA family ATPase [Bacillota bacterium]